MLPVLASCTRKKYLLLAFHPETLHHLQKYLASKNLQSLLAMMAQAYF
ncbi:hypothetical protein [Pseudoalteromonas spongiae]|nr:hypothetical protein [Pseudoalteromonas spongiae]